MSYGAKLLLGLIAALAVILMVNGSCNTTPSKVTYNSTPAPTNDAELLLSRCGTPDIDDSTQYDSPRPPIPTRLITYRKARLRFAYVPGGGAKIGDPPPYQWRLMGIVDTRTNTALSAANLKPVLSGRLPCAMGK